MFRKMRRKRQELNAETCQEILKNGKTGVLAVHGEEGYPYTVPLNYVLLNGKLYFHCAKAGHKLDAVRQNDKVSFCVIGREEIVSETFSTDYQSVVVFGRAAEVAEDAEKRLAVTALADKYSPDEPPEKRDEEISGSWQSLAVICLMPEHITGKQAKALAEK